MSSFRFAGKSSFLGMVGIVTDRLSTGACCCNSICCRYEQSQLLTNCRCVKAIRRMLDSKVAEAVVFAADIQLSTTTAFPDEDCGRFR